MLLVAASLLLAAGFQVSAQKKEKAKGKAAAAPKVEIAPIGKAVAVLNSTEGNSVRGLVTFTKEGDQVKVVAHIEGLTPGSHGFHIHEWGDCSAKDGASAGGHYNPATMAHGARDASPRHIGDLGNIEAGADGVAHVEFTDAMLKLDGPNTIVGRGVIVHAKADDLKTQPTGNAGGRQACGVIGAGKP